MVWGLPLAGIFANKRLRQKLAPFGYYECVTTPGLWYHESRPITFTLVVDNFKVKFVKKEDVDHLIVSLKTTYTLTEDWTSTLYCGITLEWDYTLTALLIFLCQDTSRKKIQEHEHAVSKKPQHCPYSPEPKQYGSEVQRPLPGNTSPLLDDKGKNTSAKNCW